VERKSGIALALPDAVFADEVCATSATEFAGEQGVAAVEVAAGQTNFPLITTPFDPISLPGGAKTFCAGRGVCLGRVQVMWSGYGEPGAVWGTTQLVQCAERAEETDVGTEARLLGLCQPASG
jgi:hypothetical protein